jgi:WD40 repeat protein
MRDAEPPSSASTPRRFDVFLSYNRLDQEIVGWIAERLRQARLEPWFDAWCLVPGADWQRGIAEGLAASRSCAVLVGPADLGAWANQEVAVALDRAATDPDFRVFLVLLPGVPERFNSAGLSPFLRMRTWIDYRGGLEDERAFADLVSAVNGLPLGPDLPTEPDSERCPYRGLEVFEEEHAEFFFGRDADVQRLLEKLKGSRFLAVLGASGSGKSSLVRAGLVPALKREASSGAERWKIGIMRPGPHPLEALAVQLLRLGAGAQMQHTLDALAADPRTLHLAGSLALAESPPETRLLLVIDQFEEVFTLCRDEHERAPFFANLLHATTIPDGSTSVLLAMRADFYHRCAAYPEVAQQMAAEQYLVSPLQPDGLRQAVEEPARRVGLAFEPGLTATILDDVAEQPGALPLLEHALLEVWQRRAGGVLSLAGYRDSGGVQGAISKRAEQVFESLEPDQQGLARRMFLRLTQPGEGTEDTRRRARLSELDGDDRHVGPLLVRLVNARLVTASRDEASGDEVVEVAHEALIRGWPRLRGWIDEDRAGLRVHRRLTEAAREWEQLGRDEDVLYRGTLLAEGIGWMAEHPAAPNQLERAFLETGANVRDRERRRRYRRLAVSGALLIIGLLVSSLAALIAFRQRDTANQERQVALSREIAAAADDQVRLDPQLALLLAVEATKQERTVEAEAALRRALEEPAPRLTIARVGTAQTAAFSPDGRSILTVNDSGRARLWDARSGKAKAKLGDGTGAGPAGGAFSSSGRLVATANDGTTTRIWTASGRLVTSRADRSAGEADSATSVLSDAPFSPDERLIVTGGGPAATVWETRTGHRRAVLLARGSVADARFGPDGRYVAASDSDARSELWEIKTGRRIAVIAGTEPYFSRDGDRLITFSDAAIRLWAVPSGRAIATLPSVPGAAAAFSQDGRYVFAGPPRDLRVYAAATGRRISRPPMGLNPVGETALSPDGRFVLSQSGSERLLLSLTTGETVARYPMHAETGPPIQAFSPDAKSVLTTDRGAVDIWALPHWTAERVGPGISRAFAASAGTRRWTVALPERRKTARIWQGPLRARTRPAASGPQIRDVAGVALSGDGRLAATLDGHGYLTTWTTSPWQKRARFATRVRPDPFEPVPIAVSPDGRLVGVMAQLTTTIWDSTTGQSLASHSENEGGSSDSVTFSPDGHLVLTSCCQAARVWQSRTGRPVASLRGHTGQINAVAFASDGRRVATASGDRTARVWEARSGRQSAVMRGHTDFVTSAAFSHDGRYLATASWDRSVRVWAASTGRRVAQLPIRAPIEAVVAFSASGQTIVVAGDGIVYAIACDVCRPIDGLLQLARSRTQRSLTAEERRVFLHE